MFKDSTLRKIVVSRGGGFSLSDDFLKILPERLKEYGKFGDDSIEYRSDPELINLLIRFGLDNVNKNFVIVEVPDAFRVSIHDYDGSEEIHQVHRKFNYDGSSEMV